MSLFWLIIFLCIFPIVFVTKLFCITLHTTGNKPYVLDAAGAVNILTENDSVSRHADVNISGIADGNGLIWSSAQGRFNAGALPSTGFSIAMAVAL